MSSLEQKAREFATEAHFGQKRKYTGVSYITHPEAVVSLLRLVEHTEEMLAAGWLHDVVEDCGVTPDQIQTKFGWNVRELVCWLTDVSKPEHGNRKFRKHLDLVHISKAPPAAKTIKLADIIDNTSSIVKYDPDFAKVYLPEKEALLNVLKDGNPVLHRFATMHLNSGKDVLCLNTEPRRLYEGL